MLTIDTKRYNTRQTHHYCDTMPMYLKGGHNACYGEVPYCRGGVNGTAGIAGNSPTLHQAWGIASTQGRRRVSYTCRRLRGVQSCSQNQTRTGTLTIGKLTVLSAVQSRSLTGLQSLSDRLHPYCFIPIIAHPDGHDSRRKALPMNAIPPAICAWCPTFQARPAPHRYGTIPLCARCYRYATQSDQATRESLQRKVRAAA